MVGLHELHIYQFATGQSLRTYTASHGDDPIVALHGILYIARTIIPRLSGHTTPQRYLLVFRL